jgi:AraC-like DNA-binding protein
MCFVFLFLPLPKTEGLKSYCVSLRLMAFAYISLACFTLIDQLSGRNIIYIPVDLIAISLQTLFFAFSLVNLMNKMFVKPLVVLKYLTPTFIFIVLFIFFEYKWGDPDCISTDSFVHNYHHPTVALNLIFLLFCIVQLIYLSALIISQIRKYKLKLDDYFAENYQLQLHWVRYCFYGGVAFCVFILISLFFPSAEFSWVVTCVNMVFYTVFGLCYIQYPRTYRYIAPMMAITPTVCTNESETKSRNVPWDKHKSIVMDNKYYTRPEIDIELMAKYLKIGRSTLSGYINREEKMSFRTWVNTLRVEEAQRIMMTHPDHSLIQVSDAVGFSEPSNFSRQFKHVTQQSPLEWKRKQLRKHKE